MQKLSIRYALFDMDGTLTDTMGYWRNLVNEYLSDEGVSLSEEDCRAIEKMNMKESVAYLKNLYPTAADGLTREALMAILERHYRTDAVVKNGVFTFLDTLKAEGARMAVATLTPKAQATVCLDHLGLAPYFDFVLTGEDYPKGKRSPEIFFDAAKRFGCAPKEMHLFEDSLYSMETAQKLGILIVAVEDRYQAHLKDAIMGISVAYFADGFSRRVK